LIIEIGGRKNIMFDLARLFDQRSEILMEFSALLVRGTFVNLWGF
jgi:hypothetical protein